MKRFLLLATLILIVACCSTHALAITVQVNPGIDGTSFTSKTYNLTSVAENTLSDGSLLDLMIEFEDPLFLEFDLDDSGGGTPGIFLNAFISWDSGRGIPGGTVDDGDATFVDLGGFPLVNSFRGTTTWQRDLGGDSTFTNANWTFLDYPNPVQFNRINIPISLPTGDHEATAVLLTLTASSGNQISVKTPTVLPGDLNGSMDLDAGDIDLLRAVIRAGATDSQFDLDGSGTVDTDDVTFLVEDLIGTSFGDANLDLAVTASGDGAILLANLGEPQGNKGWADADFDGDLNVTASADGSVMLSNLGNDAAAVPEPGSLLLATLGLLLLVCRRRMTPLRCG